MLLLLGRSRRPMVVKVGPVGADVRALLAAYDRELRVQDERRLPVGATVEREGPLQRCMGFVGGGFVVYRDLAGYVSRELDALIERQVRAFAERGEPFEWKLHGHDRPADLARRLRAAGLEADVPETVMIAEVATAARAPQLPAGVILREVGPAPISIGSQRSSRRSGAPTAAGSRTASRPSRAAQPAR
jgi:hypothetical protein